MSIRKLRFISVIVAFYMIFACGGSESTTEFFLSGTITMEVPPEHGTVFVMVTNADDLENPNDAIVEIISVGDDIGSFNMDLSNKGLAAGDKIAVLAFIDNNYNTTGGIPYPDAGDFIGFYANADKLTMQYTLHAGMNDGIDIVIDREVFSFDAVVSGEVAGNDEGDLTLIAYAGEIESSDFSSLDFSAVIGYERVTKNAGSLSYSMDILPYGYDVPIEKVYLLAFLDVNRNGEIDGGDRIGYYSAGGDDLPTLLTIDEGEVSGIDIGFYMDVMEASGLDISLSGSFTPPNGYDEQSPPVYIIISATDDPNALYDDSVSAIKYFGRVPAGEVTFDIDLSNTDLLPGDEIMIMALWDRDYDGGFPNPTRGDFIGFYANADKLTMQYTLHAGVNDGIDIVIDREVFSFDAVVSGDVIGEDEGDLTLIAYAGEIDFFDFSNLDFSAVIGFERVTKGAGPLSYSMDILPYGYDVPIEKVYLLAFLDVNRNGEIDGGDRIGYYSAGGYNLPTLLTIDEGEVSGIDIGFYMDVMEAPG